jgi:hypothetical protein
MKPIVLTLQIVDIRGKGSGLEKVIRSYGVYVNCAYLGKVTQWTDGGVWEVKRKGSQKIFKKKTLRAAVLSLISDVLDENFCA